MSQKAFLANFDAMSHAAFADAGMADAGRYYANASDTDGQLVKVFIDRDTQSMGLNDQAQAGRVEVSYVLASGLQLSQGGRLVVDGDVYVNAKPVSDDGSLSRWLVRRG